MCIGHVLLDKVLLKFSHFFLRGYTLHLGESGTVGSLPVLTDLVSGLLAISFLVSKNEGSNLELASDVEKFILLLLFVPD